MLMTKETPEGSRCVLCYSSMSTGGIQIMASGLSSCCWMRKFLMLRVHVGV